MTFFRWFDVADVIDIAIVAMLFYAGLVWFKKTRAFLVVVGIVILGVVYALGRFFNLFLTTAILQSFFTVFLVAVIVIFQEELRHFFERVALWGLGHRPKPEAPRLVEVLVRTAGDLARARVGALIVIAGRDPLERHIEGGTELGGIPSEPLLKSIFDTHTPGHDGAAIIQGGDVTRFAVYLPLSKDLDKIAGRGTRHTAALGLAERWRLSSPRSAGRSRSRATANSGRWPTSRSSRRSSSATCARSSRAGRGGASRASSPTTCARRSSPWCWRWGCGGSPPRRPGSCSAISSSRWSTATCPRNSPSSASSRANSR